MSEEFAIYDALLWEPPEGYSLLDYHLRRLEQSSAHFRFPLDVTTAREKLLDYAQQLPSQPRKVRLDLAATGVIVLRDESVKPSTLVAVAVSGEAVDSGDEFLHHKTTRREVYDRALLAHPGVQDVLLWNERREITETCHGNVVLESVAQFCRWRCMSNRYQSCFRGCWGLARGALDSWWCVFFARCFLARSIGARLARGDWLCESETEVPNQTLNQNRLPPPRFDGQSRI